MTGTPTLKMNNSLDNLLEGVVPFCLSESGQSEFPNLSFCTTFWSEFELYGSVLDRSSEMNVRHYSLCIQQPSLGQIRNENLIIKDLGLTGTAFFSVARDSVNSAKTFLSFA